MYKSAKYHSASNFDRLLIVLEESLAYQVLSYGFTERGACFDDLQLTCVDGQHTSDREVHQTP